VASLIPDMFCNFYLLKNHKIVYNSATIEAIEKFRILAILEIFLEIII
jgi:hypothetical protein